MGSPSHTVNAAIDFLAGTAGGVASVYVGQPLDTVKVKLQTFPDVYPSAARCFLETLQQDGVRRGLYAGTVPSLLAQVSENAVLFLAYGVCQKAVAALHGRQGPLGVADKAAAGSLAGFFAALVLCPTELVKCRMQAMREMDERAASAGRPGTGSGIINNGSIGSAQGVTHRQPLHNRKLGPWMVTKQILTMEGVRGLSRGMAPTLAREMFGYSFFFGGYEMSKVLLTPPGNKSGEQIGALRTIACGAVGGSCFWLAIFPLDVIKSRVQIQRSDAGRVSLLPAMWRILTMEGAGALYKGLLPTLVRTIPATGALFWVYESTKHLLGGHSH